MDGETLNILNVCNGGVPEVFERELAGVLKNIADANTDPEAKRKISLEFIISPFKDRSGAQIEFRCASKVPGVDTVKGQVFFKRAGAELIALPHDPRQIRMFQQPGPDSPKVS